MKRVLLTGAKGFVGSNAIAPLLAKGYEVHAVSSKAIREKAIEENGVKKNVIWHTANLLDSKETASLIAKVRPTHLLHFAWYAEPGMFWQASQNFHWLQASVALLRSFSEFGGQRVVMAGTCAEYDWDYGFCSEYVTPLNPATPYGVCKNALQQVLHSYSSLDNNTLKSDRQQKLSSAWGRIFFLYGPNEHPSRLVSSVITRLLRGEVARCSHGNQLRDFMHVEDVAAAFVVLLDSVVEGPMNIASGRPVALREVVLAAADCLGARELVQFGAISAPAKDPPLLVGDNRRLLNEIGWHQQYELQAGIERAVNWWKLQLKQGI